MKPLKSIFSIALVIILNISFAATAPNHNGNDLSAQITKMVSFPKHAKSEFANQLVTVKFMLKKDGVIDVLGVDGDNELSQYIQNKLGGQLLNAGQSQLNKVYQMDIVFRLL